MTRLAVAQTLVSGTVTLQGIAYSFTASASGTATADRVPQAKKAATVASNAAAVTAARASIDKILVDNSAILSDLEIISLISNNFTTTVRIFKPIALETIATTTDGINYFIDKETTIGKSQWLKVTDDVNLTIDAPFTNKGFVQLANKGTCTSNQPVNNSSYWYNLEGLTYNLHNPWNNIGDGFIWNYGTFVVRNANNAGGQGYINNNGSVGVINYGRFTIETNGSINNNNEIAYILNASQLDEDPNLVGIFCNNGSVSCRNQCYNSGTWSGTGRCNGTCPTSTGTCS